MGLLTTDTYTLTIGAEINTDELIKQLDKSNPPKPRIDQTIIVYNRKTHETTARQGRLNPLGLFGSRADEEHYLVDTDARLKTTYEYALQSAAYGKINILFALTLSCLPGREATLVELLARRNAPAKQLHSLLQEWLEETLQKHWDAIYNNQQQFITNAGNYLAEKAKKCGIQLKDSIHYKSEAASKPLENIQIDQELIQVQPVGYSNFVALKIETVLTPDPSMSAAIHTSLNYQQKDEFRVVLVNGLQEYIRENISYNSLIDKLNEDVRRGLIAHWNQQLRNSLKGWLVAELRLTLNDAPAPEFKFESVKIPIRLSNATVELTHTVIMNLENAEVYNKACIANLETWIREKLHQTAQNVLTKETYAQLVADIADLGKVIKNDLDREVRKIGYRVDYLLTSDLFNSQQLRFDLRFDEQEQAFQTSLNDIVNLDVTITGKIRSLNHPTWHKLLLPGINFSDEMKKEVLRTVRQTVQRFTPNEFYTKFSTIVGPKLVSTISNLLQQHFNVEEDVDILPKMGTSIILEIMKKLQEGIHAVDVVCFNESVQYQISFFVTHVEKDLWPRFIARVPKNVEDTVALIGKVMREYTEGKIQRELSNPEIVLDERLSEVIALFIRASVKAVEEYSGLVVEIASITQKQNKVTDEMRLLQLGNSRNRVLALTNQLHDKRIEIDKAVDAEEPSAKIRKLEDELKIMQQRLKDMQKEGAKTLNNSDDGLARLLSDRDAEVKEGKGDTAINDITDIEPE